MSYRLSQYPRNADYFKTARLDDSSPKRLARSAGQFQQRRSIISGAGVHRYGEILVARRSVSSSRYRESPVDLTFAFISSQIKNSVEVLIAEELMERGLKVVDCNGDSWRPRLRTGGSTGVRKKKAVRPVAL